MAVLLLWVSTALLPGLQQGGAFLPLLVWAIWTLILFLCGWAAWTDDYLATLINRVAGLVSYTMLVIYYITMQATYLAFIPTDLTPDNPDLWPTLYLVINLAIPSLLVTTGIARTAVQKIDA